MTNEDLIILAEDVVAYCEALQAASTKLKTQIEKLVGPKAKAPSIPESTFSALEWSSEKGATLGDYQVAYENHNLPDKWNHAYNILKANSSLIANPFHAEGYSFRYWIFPEKAADRIFRKKLEGP
jgi:hypothetical protein